VLTRPVPCQAEEVENFEASVVDITVYEEDEEPEEGGTEDCGEDDGDREGCGWR